jgi:folate-binding protein YgfZ
MASTFIRLTGADALEVLHRVTTQHLRDLAPGQCAMTLACDFRGRLLHRFAVVNTATGILLLRDDAPADSLVEYIDRQIFREKVTIADESAEWNVALRVDDGGLELGTFRMTAGSLHVALRPEPRFTLHVEKSGTPLDGSREVERVRAGIPRHGDEISEDFNAFEVGLQSDVHLNKGCFTGQEALLRMMTYGGVRRRLVLLRGTGAPPASRSSVRAAGESVGVVTHAVADGAAWIGLGRDEARGRGRCRRSRDRLRPRALRDVPRDAPRGVARARLDRSRRRRTVRRSRAARSA